ncbi:MAG: hypothetical protein R2880_05440 [Deinococcales bacterium]
MQRVAVQADPNTLMQLSQDYIQGAKLITDLVHPFRKNFDELQLGEAIRVIAAPSLKLILSTLPVSVVITFMPIWTKSLQKPRFLANG